jgi:hypothetical protein
MREVQCGFTLIAPFSIVVHKVKRRGLMMKVNLIGSCKGGFDIRGLWRIFWPRFLLLLLLLWFLWWLLLRLLRRR